MKKVKTGTFTYSGSQYVIEYDYDKDPPTVVAVYQQGNTQPLNPSSNTNVITSPEAKQAIISSVKGKDVTKGNNLANNANFTPAFDPTSTQTYQSNNSTNTQPNPSLDPITNTIYTQIGNLTNLLSGFQTITEITEKKTSLDKLYQDKVFIYPRDLLMPENPNVRTSLGQDYCKITAIKYSPPNKDFFSSTSQDPIQNILKTGLVSKNDAGFKKASTNPGFSEKLVGAVYLPMPNALSDVNEVTWGESAMSPITAIGLAGAIQAGGTGNVGGAIGDALVGAITDPALKAQLISKFGMDALRVFSAGLIDVSPEDLLARATGTIANPNAELLFRGVKMRQFNFEWSFYPRDDIEAKEVRSIIRFFKQNSSPSRGSTDDKGEANLGTLVFAPNTFFIQFLNNKENLKSVFKIKKSALTSMNVTYTPGKQWQSVDDPNVKSQPIGMILKMQFTELVPVYQNDYSEFDTDLSDIGY